ncbi:hypothetical protein GGTG_03530 [Gaeumannomyces tritici R3-111a-1]|uniref:Uncharacterized protein n=1 Tax=Gaeumannomyces tritici (strain R3-111a-1) TaxID=644352 RepID=J3NQH3_GAET3|nr:hypothetical protein GGTG_03530 [Gaeumannomyces tritici R3-111a-1]EJT78429.1 hypothetical protein GGTG_03530 [Gaeumannomyces tritici R3-111a-1]
MATEADIGPEGLQIATLAILQRDEREQILCRSLTARTAVALFWSQAGCWKGGYTQRSSQSKAQVLALGFFLSRPTSELRGEEGLREWEVDRREKRNKWVGKKKTQVNREQRGRKRD